MRVAPLAVLLLFSACRTGSLILPDPNPTPSPSPSASASATPPAEYNAVLRNSCAPFDGPAWELLISDAIDVDGCATYPDAPATSILWWEPLEPTLPATLDSNDNLSGYGYDCPGMMPPCVEANHIVLHLDAWGDTDATGSYSLEFGDGNALTGAFRARVCWIDFACG